MIFRCTKFFSRKTSYSFSSVDVPIVSFNFARHYARQHNRFCSLHQNPDRTKMPRNLMCYAFFSDSYFDKTGCISSVRSFPSTLVSRSLLDELKNVLILTTQTRSSGTEKRYKLHFFQYHVAAGFFVKIILCFPSINVAPHSTENNTTPLRILMLFVAILK